MSTVIIGVKLTLQEIEEVCIKFIDNFVNDFNLFYSEQLTSYNNDEDGLLKRYSLVEFISNNDILSKYNNNLKVFKWYADHPLDEPVETRSGRKDNDKIVLGLSLLEGEPNEMRSCNVSKISENVEIFKTILSLFNIDKQNDIEVILSD